MAHVKLSLAPREGIKKTHIGKTNCASFDALRHREQFFKRFPEAASPSMMLDFEGCNPTQSLCWAERLAQG